MVVNRIFVKLVLLAIYTNQLAGASDENLCPGINVLFSCSSAGALAWSGTAFEGECTGTSLTFSPSDFNTSQCGQFSLNNTIISGSNPLFPDAMGLSSAIMFTTDLGTLNGETVMCSVPADPSPRVDVTLRIQDLTATSLMFTQLNTTSGEFSWEVDQGSMCDMTFVVTVTGNGFMREYRDDLTSTIANFGDTLSPGTYTFTVSTISGNSVFISSPQEFTLILKILPPTLVHAALACSTSPPTVNVEWDFNTTTSSGSTLDPRPDFVYINSTSLSGEVNVTQVRYPGTSTSLLLTRQTNYTIVASSWKNGFGKSVNNPQVSIYVEAHFIDKRTLSANDCITVTLNRQCSESVTLFTPQLSYGLCTGQRDTVTGTFDSATNSTCLPLSNIPLGQICYEVSLSYNGVVLEGSAQNGTYSFSGCMTSQLDTLTAQSRVTYTPDCSERSPGTLPHGTSVTFACGSCNTLTGPTQSVCRDGTWTNPVQRSCRACTGHTNSASIAITFVTTFILALSCGYSIGVFSVIVWKKASQNRVSKGEVSREDAIYEEPSEPVNIETDDNIAYGKVKVQTAL